MDAYGVVFDDDPANLSLALRILGRRFAVRGFSRVEHGVELLKDASFVVSDYDMPGLGGNGLVQLVRTGVLTTRLLILSGDDSLQPELADLESLGISFLPKPYGSQALLEIVSGFMVRTRAELLKQVTRAPRRVSTA